MPIHNISETAAFYLSRTFVWLRLEYPRGIYLIFFSLSRQELLQGTTDDLNGEQVKIIRVQKS